MCRGPACWNLCVFACRAGYFAGAAAFLAAPRIGAVTTAGLRAYGSIICPDIICSSVLTPVSFPNTGAVIVTETFVFFCDASLGTRPVYAHTPPQPYSMFDEEISFVPFSMLTLGGLTFPPLVKFRGP